MRIHDEWSLILATHNGRCRISDQGPFGPQSMSALGHKRTWPHARSMSASLPKADMAKRDRDVRSTSLLAQRISIRKFRPAVQPSSARPWVNALNHARGRGSLSSDASNTPTRRVPRGCVSAESGHPATAPPSKAIISRRLICLPYCQIGAS
jgi:hypothetical protein